MKKMKVHLLDGAKIKASYVLSVLRTLCDEAGVEVVDTPEEADALWVSMYDQNSLPVLKKAREMAGDRLVIMGGFEAWCAPPYLAWADAAVVGEGWEFIEAWGRDPAEALALPCVCKKDSTEILPSYVVPWERFPLTKMPPGHHYYFMGGRGCRNKCKFCMTSWIQPNSNCPPEVIARAVEYVEQQPKGKLTIVTNDSQAVIESKVVNAQSVTVRAYLDEPERYKSNMLHFGIEGWTEADRARLGKPISDDMLRELQIVTGENKQQCEFFFIVGYPGYKESDVWEFIDNVAMPDARLYPRIFVKCTYFNPAPYTPYQRTPFIESYIDRERILREFHVRQKRVRMFPKRSPGREAWRCVIRRATAEEAILIGNQPNWPDAPGTVERFAERLRKVGLEHLLSWEGPYPYEIIKTRIV